MKTLVFALSALLCLFTSNLNAAYSGGSGTKSKPYQIATKADLLALAVTPTHYSKDFILTANINLEGETFTSAVIASDTDNITSDFQGTAFTGTFDGDGYSISNLTIVSDSDYLGLFGQTDTTGEIKNLTLEQVHITGGDSSWYLGALCGVSNDGDFIFSNCCVTGIVIGGDSSRYLGGLCGRNEGSISGCYTTCDVTGGIHSENVGGLCGQNDNDGQIGNSYATGIVSSKEDSMGLGSLCGRNDGTINNCYTINAVISEDNSSEIGCICGRNDGGIITHCYAKGTITVGIKSRRVGGLCGKNSDGGTISNSYTTGTVTGGEGSEKFGGLCGENTSAIDKTTSTIYDCYATGAVSGGISSKDIGGLCGYNYEYSSIHNCYAMGAVTSGDDSESISGLCGINYGEIINSFWDIQTSGQIASNGGTGQTTAQMKTLSTFTSAGWDFVVETANGAADIWKMEINGTDYPKLNWDFVIPGLLPDVIVHVDIYSPGFFNIGDSFSFSGYERNVGYITVNSDYYVDLYLSLDRTIDDSDIRLVHDLQTYSLGPNIENPTGLKIISIPAYTPSGTYYLCAVNDPTNAIEESDETNNEWWSDSANITVLVENEPLIARDHFAGCVIGDRFYVFGGNGNPDQVNLNSGQIYNIGYSTWSSIASNHHNDPENGVEEVCGAGLDGIFYVFGGWGGTKPSGYYGVINFNEAYNPATNTWTTLTQKPTTTSASTPAVYNGKIYLFGGWYEYEGPGGDGACHPIVEAYDPATNTWQSKADMPKSLSSPAIAVYNNSAYVIGGYDVNAGTMNTEVMVYNFASNTWIRNYCTIPADAARAYSSAAETPVIDGKVYLVGGSEGTPDTDWASDKITIFDITARQCQTRALLAEPRSGHLTLIYNNKIYVIGGYADADGIDRAKSTVYCLDIPRITSLEINKAAITAGKLRGLDSIQFAGLLDATGEDILAANDIVVDINADNMLSPLKLTFPITTTTFKKGKFSGINSNNSFKLDTKTGKMTFSAKNVNLTGLACPVTVTITIGDYKAELKLDEAVVNGTKPCPLPLMQGVKNSLDITKSKFKKGKTNGTDSLTVSGKFTIAGDYKASSDLVIALGNQTFWVPGDQMSSKNGIASCKAFSTVDEAIVTVKLHYAKCTFTISIKNAWIIESGEVDFRISCFDVNLLGLETIVLN